MSEEKYPNPLTISVLVHSPAETRAVYAALAAGGFSAPAPLVSRTLGYNLPRTGETLPASEDAPKVEEAKVRKPRTPKAAETLKPEPTPTPDSDEQPETEEDEFAAFRDADGAGKPIEPITDADLSSACNDAAAAMGSPNAVKALIAQFVPEGEVVHSRNVPLDKRSDFVEQIKALHK